MSSSSLPAYNYLWVNISPPVLYGAVDPIYLTSADLTPCKCFTTLVGSLEYSGNFAGNPIYLVVSWYNHNKTLLLSETICSSTTSSANIDGIVSVKGAYARLHIDHSLNNYFTAATQATFQTSP